MDIGDIFHRLRGLEIYRKNLFSLLLFVLFDFLVIFLCLFFDSGYPLFLLFLPVTVTSLFYLKKLNLFPVFLGSLSLLLLSIVYYWQLFFERLLVSVSNWLIFSALFLVVSVLIGYINVSFEELNERRQEELFKRKSVEEKKDFIGSLFTHDLRNHLQVTKGYLDLIEDDLDGDNLEKMRKAGHSIDRILDLTDKMKKISSLEHMEPQEISQSELRDMLEETIERDEKIAEEKGIELKTCLEFSSVEGGDFIREIVHNLIQNAIQHADCEKILVSSEDRGSELVISVEDDGVGIGEDEKDEIFDLMYSEKSGSGGMGLYLIKEIVEIYGGEILVGDSELGGVRFDVFLRKPV